MPAAPIPPDEERRLAALNSYGILDSPPDEAFDRLTRLAASLAGTPIAMISLVDAERQWFKSRVGIEASQTPRDQAFCGYAILQAEPLVVEDASTDPRFADNFLVTGKNGFRFYAGVPLTTPSGDRLGTLCALDVQPRSISADQLRHLGDLAGAVVTTLELHRTLRLMERQTCEDPLTGLANRARLTQCLAVILEPRREFVPFSVLYLGCDDMKLVNETMGRDSGDALLRVLGEEMPAWVRVADIAARVAGDEFALLLPGAGERVAMAVAHRVLDSGAELMRRHAWPVTFSIGVACFSEPPPSPDEVVRIAEGAMNHAKLQGKRRVVGTHYPLGREPQPLEGLASLQHALRAGLERDELFLQYQPIVPIGNRRAEVGAAGMEALVRWRHPSLGIIPPSTFIPGAERSGLIMPLGDAVLGMALRRMRSLLAAGEAPAYVSVNVAAPQLRAPDFAAKVLAALEREQVPASRLMLELTEGTVIDGTGLVMETLNALAACGVRLAIDDFGTGYSSLRYLRELPVHVLKIDRSFVEDIVGNPRDVSIVAAIVAMAHTLGLITVAEGIETEAQRDTLTLLGCDFGQGWLFGRPA